MGLKYSRLDPILEPLMAAVRRAERFLGPEDDWVEDDRRILYEAAQRHLGQYHTFVHGVGKEDYVTTAHADSDVIERVLMDAGYQRNLASTRKYRTHHGGGKQWACGAFVLPLNQETDGLKRQHHVYLFNGPNGGTDVYAHEETSVTEGAEHLTEGHMEHGKVFDLYDVLAAHGIEYGLRESLK